MTGARSGPWAIEQVQLVPIAWAVVATKGWGKKNHIRGRCAWRMFSGSGVPGCVEALGADRRADEEKVRPAMDLVAEATERPEPKRITERAEAIVEGRAMAVEGTEGT